MKRLITTFVILFFVFCAYAQDANKTITLNEVTVKGCEQARRYDDLSHRCSEAIFKQWLQHS